MIEETSIGSLNKDQIFQEVNRRVRILKRNRRASGQLHPVVKEWPGKQNRNDDAILRTKS